jgi:choline dehydrogenase-like flavoprotein
MSTPNKSFDYIVVGAGAAGCVVANRLSEDGSTVLLLEAGGKDSNPLIHIPVGFTKLTTPDVNWGYSTVPQPQMNNREMWYPQGRTLGGSTSINAMIYIRGNKLDYETWAKLGNTGWGYDGVLPYYRKSEHNERFSNEYHGFGGPMSVSTQIECNPLSKAWVRAQQELGTPYNPDVNGADQYGVTYYDVTQRNARRESASTAFLRPAKDRPNLTIITRALAGRVVVENGRAVGVEYATKEGRAIARANREVILSGGAVNSPKLLMLSGIGDAAELKQVGIEPVHHLPGVGKNFQDHMDVYLTAETAPVSYNMEDRPDRAARHMLQYLLYRKGPMTAAVCEAGAFVYSSEFGGPEAESPDIQMHILPAYVIDHGRQRRKGHGITINTCNLRPHSIGSVKLKSANPSDHPLIDPNFCGDKDGYDWRVSMAGFRWGRAILESEALKPLVKYEYMPGRKVQTDDELKAYIREWSKTDYHPVGSCKMGDDDMAVVDQELRVHGLEGLRVIDASVMPTLISGNTQAPSIMIGEKGSAIIRAGALV